MTQGLGNTIRRVVRPGIVTGPIFGKELRCAGRKKRHYALRCAYLGLLTVFLVLVWMTVVDQYGRESIAMRISKMPEAGKRIILAIVWFQFIATQLVAVILMSTSISDEIYRRTLGVLMTTPLTSMQIVMGKLLSRLWMLVMLLGISVPLLVVVRVFGGVPWDYVTAGLCITSVAMLFAAATSMFISIFCRRAYLVILLTLMVGGLLYFLLPWAAFTLARDIPGGYGAAVSAATYVNPVMSLNYETTMMLKPGARGMLSVAVSWEEHCAAMLGLTGAILLACVLMVRRAALAQAAGPAVPRRLRRIAAAAAVAAGVAVPPRHAPSRRSVRRKIRRVFGPAIAWKEFRTPMLRGFVRKLILSAVLLLVLAGWYLLGTGTYKSSDTHRIYLLTYCVIGLLFTAMRSATNITAEKEARTWSILMAAPLSEWQILWGKAVGVLWRSLPVWFLLLGHVLVFSLLGEYHPIGLLHFGMLVTWVMVLLAGTGLYLGTVCKRTTTAVVLNIALGLVLWVVGPLLVALTVRASGSYSEDLVQFCLDANPVAQASYITDGSAGRANAARPAAELTYFWSTGTENATGTTAILATSMLLYGGIGLLFAWLARHNMRQTVF
jgi:ABC-type transport system involved in multi-copper enzyme maturation permease subunit